MKSWYTIILFLVFVLGCAGTRRFDPIPSNLDLERCTHDTLTIRARHFAFEPESIRLAPGTLVHLTLLSVDGTHGFALPAFGIDVHLDESVPQTLEVYFPEKGEYPFRCSHFCGLGHFGMSGKFIVE